MYIFNIRFYLPFFICIYFSSTLKTLNDIKKSIKDFEVEKVINFSMD